MTPMPFSRGPAANGSHRRKRRGGGSRRRRHERRSFSMLTARDVMRAPLVTVPLGAPLSEVERTLAEEHITGAPVTDAQGRIVGVVTVRDLIELYAEEPASRPLRREGFFETSADALADEDLDRFEIPADSEATTADAMTAHVHTVAPTASLTEVARRMAEHRIHRILVEEDGRHVGIIGTFDLLDAL